MNIIIIGSTAATPTQKDKDYYQSYIDYFTASAKHVDDTATVSVVMLDELLIEVGDGDMRIFDTHNGKELTEYDSIFFRGSKFREKMDVIATVNEYAKRNNIKTINEYDGVRDSSKLLQAAVFESINVPVAKTIDVNDGLLNNFDKVTHWDFPCILKAKHGSHGNDNYVVASLDEVRSITQQDVSKRFVLQRFVPNDGDFRILIIGQETMVIGRTAQEGSHLNNTSKGGAAVEVATDSLPETVISQAHAIARHFGMSIAGVDALQDKNTGEFFFLEVNAQPQLMSGAFVDEKSVLLGKLLLSIENNK